MNIFSSWCIQGSAEMDDSQERVCLYCLLLIMEIRVYITVYIVVARIKGR